MNNQLAIPRWLSRLLLVAMMGSLMSLGTTSLAGAAPAAPQDIDSCFSPAPHSFSDVASGSFANTAVSWLVEEGITSGVTDNEFRPNQKVTRAQMAVFLWRDECGPTEPTKFSSAAYGNIQVNVPLPGDPDATPPTDDQIIPDVMPVTGYATGGWAQAANGPFNVDLVLNDGSFPLEVPGIGTLVVSYSIPEISSGAGHFDPETGVGGFDMDIGVTTDEVDLLGPIGQPCDVIFGLSVDGQIDANTGVLDVSQTSFDFTPPAESDCGGLGGVFGDLLGGPDTLASLSFQVGTF